MKKLFLAAALSATALTGVAIASQVADRAAPPATRAEAAERADQRFARLDINKDGQLSADERSAKRGMARSDRPERLMARADADNDGVVTREEHRAGAVERADTMFDRLDTDKDGRVTTAEADARPAKRARGMRGGGAAPGGAVTRADANGDGNISREEHRAQALARFTRLDANNDGRIDDAERAAMRGKRMQRPGA